MQGTCCAGLRSSLLDMVTHRSMEFVGSCPIGSKFLKCKMRCPAVFMFCEADFIFSEGIINKNKTILTKNPFSSLLRSNAWFETKSSNDSFLSCTIFSLNTRSWNTARKHRNWHECYSSEMVLIGIITCTQVIPHSLSVDNSVNILSL